MGSALLVQNQVTVSYWHLAITEELAAHRRGEIRDVLPKSCIVVLNYAATHPDAISHTRGASQIIRAKVEKERPGLRSAMHISPLVVAQASNSSC